MGRSNRAASLLSVAAKSSATQVLAQLRALSPPRRRTSPAGRRSRRAPSLSAGCCRRLPSFDQQPHLLEGEAQRLHLHDQPRRSTASSSYSRNPPGVRPAGRTSPRHLRSAARYARTARPAPPPPIWRRSALFRSLPASIARSHASHRPDGANGRSRATRRADERWHDLVGRVPHL